MSKLETLQMLYINALEKHETAQRQFDEALPEYVEAATYYWKYCDERAKQLKQEIEKELRQAPVLEKTTGKTFFSSILSRMK